MSSHESQLHRDIYSKTSVGDRITSKGDEQCPTQISFIVIFLKLGRIALALIRLLVKQVLENISGSREIMVTKGMLVAE